MNVSESLIRKAGEAEKKENWSSASLLYIEAASEAISIKEHELASELYMRAAVCLERLEQWRQIGVLWLQSAAALQGKSNPVGEGRYIDVDAAKHNFPTIDPLFWNALPKEERIGRALRNSGYHLEKAGTNQSAYRQYEMAGSTFRKARLWDEASRSYLLAARSYIRQHGELDVALREDLETCLNELIKQDEHQYLKRLIFYYRHLRVDLNNQGNIDQANDFYVEECRARAELHGSEGHFLKKWAYKLWDISSRYGTSFNRWFGVSCSFVFLFFPPFYYFAEKKEMRLVDNILRAVIQSINAFLGRGDIQANNTLFHNVVTLSEVMCGYIMLGSLAAMIISRITR